jgi:hypothetical protein
MPSSRAVQLRRIAAGLVAAAALLLCLGLSGAGFAAAAPSGPLAIAEHGTHALVGTLGHASVAAAHVRPALELSAPVLAFALCALCTFMMVARTPTGVRRRPQAGFASRAPPHAAR